MGKIIFIDVDADGQYPKDRDIRNLLRYIAGKNGTKEEVRYCNGKGLPKNPNKAAEGMVLIQKYFGKANKRRAYQFILSFREIMEDANYVKLVAERVAEIFYETHQVYYGVHEDTDNLHVHFAVNAVSYVDGKKWHHSKKDLKRIEGRIESIMDELL